MTTPNRVVLPALLFLAVTAGVVCAQNNTADTAKLIEVLKLQPGDVVAEIGAGGGELTLAIARHVGPGGRVLTSELGAERVAALRDAVAKNGAANVEVLESHALRTNLPDACCAAIFMRNVYHHFGDTTAMNASVFQALRPGGRLAVIDFPPRNNAESAPAGQRADGGAHGVSAETVAAELKAAGFAVVSQDERPNRWFVVVATKPQ